MTRWPYECQCQLRPSCKHMYAPWNSGGRLTVASLRSLIGMPMVEVPVVMAMVG